MLVLALACALSGPARSSCSDLEHCSITGVSPTPLLREADVDGSKLRDFVDQTMKDHLGSGAFAGAAVAVVKDGKALLVQGYGYADVEKHLKADGETTVFRLGSVSKLVTFTAVMQLVQQGKLNLDADVNSYLSAFQLPATFAQPVTLHNLMTHTAGFETTLFGHQVASGPEGPDALEKTLAGHTPARMLPPITRGSTFAPHMYSNYNGALAGYIVAQVSKESFEKYVEEHIFKALEMNHSTFREPVPADKGVVATGYSLEQRPDGVQKLLPHDFEYFHRIAPASSMSTSAADMARFMIAHLDLEHGKESTDSILSAKAAQLMHQRQYSPDPYVNGSAYGFMERYINGRRVLWHNGGLSYAGADLYLWPDENVGLFIAYNTLPLSVRDELFHAVMDRFFRADKPWLVPAPDAAARVQRYTGLYADAHRNATWEKYMFGMASNQVTATKRGTLEIGWPARSVEEEWVEVPGHPGLFHSDYHDRMVAFEERDGRMYLLGDMASWPMVKGRFYETPAFTQALLNALLTAFTVTVLFMISCLVLAHQDPGFAHRYRVASLLACAPAILGAATILSLNGVVTTPVPALLVEVPTSLYVTFVLGMSAAALTAVYVLYVAWRSLRDPWRLPSLAGYLALALPPAALLVWLDFWNLLGWRVST